MTWFDSMYDIPHGEIPVKLLGVPLISSKLTINDCTPLIDKIINGIFSWTMKFLALAGRAQLIKAVMFSTQAYWSNRSILPGAVHKNIQKLLTRFFWKGDERRS